jgi:tetratricopeptide (TPR) repeat protein
MTAFAQTGELRGHVSIKQADGTTIPAADATIDVYRMDINGKFNTKTNKKGEFVFAGLPYVGTYVIVVSQATASPAWLPEVKAGRDVDYKLTMDPGDGRRLTFDEVKTLMKQGRGASSGPVKESESDKAKREELARKTVEIEASNKKIEAANVILERTLKAGNTALEAKNYDEAIRQYQEGLAADAKQPPLLTNLAITYKARGIERYNSAITSKDDAAKTAGLEGAKADFRDAAQASAKAVAVNRELPAPTDPAALERYNKNKMSALSIHAEAMRLFVTKVDPAQADAGVAAFQDLIAIETDPVKNKKAQLDAVLMLLDSGSSEKAFAAAQKILETEPDNVEALRYAGIALFQSGDKAKFQDAANYLQRFVDKAPDTHPDKQSAKEALDYLKTAENVKPVKTTPTTSGRRTGKKP